MNFSYTARDESGALCNGTIVAASEGEARRVIRAEGKYPTALRPAAETLEISPLPRLASGIKVSRNDVIQFSMQLSTMLETGVTLTEALGCIAQQIDKPNFKRLVDDLSAHVEAGGDFSTALSRHPRSFPRLYVALMRASEKSGMLSKLLLRTTNYLRDEQETVRRVRGALTYPAVMLAFAVTTTIFLLAFVLPRFTVIYANKGAALPAPTKILMMLSDGVVHHWLALLAAVVATIFGAAAFLRTRIGRRVFHHVELNMPVLGTMFRKLYLTRALRMIGTMSSAGVTLVDCVNTANELCANSYFRKLWDDVSSQIQSGKQMSEPLSQSKLVPRSIAQMIHSGERSGKLSLVMEQVATFSETELKEKISELTRYI
ncbi:MAG: type II secretion system F family protein, partial [Tepidisphaeraceae bacterium]